ncbi:MAG: putative cyclase/dehyrase [Myxococcales bacterium]|nr:putative cyclase/dehyrase [Myxococcales bacterium]
MPTIQCSEEIRARADELFALGQDYERRLSWDPFVREIRFLDGATETRVGVMVRVKARNGLMMVVRYTTVQAPRHVAIAMVTGPAIFRIFCGAWTFESVSEDRTRVTFRYHFTLRTLPAARILSWIVARVLRWEMSRRLAAFKRAGEAVRAPDRTTGPSSPGDRPAERVRARGRSRATARQ